MNNEANNNLHWKFDKYILIVVAACLAIIAYTFYDSITNMVRYWKGHEEFGHAFFLPFISMYLIYLKRYELAVLPVTHNIIGVLIVCVGVSIFIVGNIGAVFVIQQYALVVTLIGVFVSLFGVKVSSKVALPLFLLFFIIPLPGFLYNTLSGELQLLSSQIGVFIIRLFDISVYLEGNVIDLGVYKLQVVEACSGLRYLFPLMSLGLMMAYIFRSSIVNKIIIFLSTIPVTVLMNSFRIGMIGVLVEYYGISMAEGFLHDFEGWIIFMACIFILILEMWLITKIGKRNIPFSESFNLDVVIPDNYDESKHYLKGSKTVFILLPVFITTLLISAFVGNKENIIPDRKKFSEFPMVFEGYQGRKDYLDSTIIDALNFDDYLKAFYVNEDKSQPIGLYIGYYGSQNAEKVPHSPKACLPGGGWVVASSDVVPVTINESATINVNRVVIYKGSSKQLVYYWFKQRNRNIASEYAVKWYLLVDSITMNRTDGALIRFTMPVEKGETLDQADQKLKKFIASTYNDIKDYIPD